MTQSLDQRGAIVDQLEETWRSIAEACESLAPEEWEEPTDCPGWRVHDQVAHMTGTEWVLAGRQPLAGVASEAAAAADAPPYVRNEMGRANEAWVSLYRDLSHERLLDNFKEITAERVEQLGAMSEADFDAPAMTPVGKATYRRLMQIRVFDCWVHEQDIRCALRRPGHLAGPAAEQSVEEIVRALGYLFAKRAGAPEGASLELRLTGGVNRVVYVAVTGGRGVVTGAPAPSGGREPTVTLRADSAELIRLACGRRDPGEALERAWMPAGDREQAAGREQAGAGSPLGSISLAGDRALGEALMMNLAFTI